MTMSNFDKTDPLTETILFGSGTKLMRNLVTMKTKNDPANRYVQHKYRKGRVW